MSAVALISVTDAPLLARAHYDGAATSPLVAVWAHTPEILDAVMPFLGAVYGLGALEPRLKEIDVLRTSVRSGCRYCTATHTVVARDLAFTGDELCALRGEGPLPASFDERERAAATFAERVQCEPAAAVEALHPRFADHEIVELTTVATATLFLNRFATALGLPIAPATYEAVAALGFACS